MLTLKPLQIHVFPTACGWSLLAGYDQTVHHLLIGCDSARDAEERWKKQSDSDPETEFLSTDWYPEARQAIQDYFAGEAVDLSFISCDLTGFTPFQQQVLQEVRQIPRGQLLTYGEVARRVNRPQAARAVGGTMARNAIPLIIPCHRVVGSNGQLTGFSAPQGLLLKRHLLEMEEALPAVARKLF